MMDEAVTSRSAPKQKIKVFSPADIFFSLSGLLLELGSTALSPAASAAALAGGLYGRKSVCVIAGGVLGAVLHGFPTAFSGLLALGIIFFAQLIPEFENTKVKAAFKTAVVFVSVIVSRLSEADSTAALLKIIISAISAAVFTLCVHLLSDSTKLRGFDALDIRDCALSGITAMLAFMSLGALDYSAANIGRIVLGTAVLILLEEKGLGISSVIAVSGVLGLCSYSASVGTGGAIFAFSAIISKVFSKSGKIVRTLWFVFISVSAVLVTETDEGSWRMLAEAVTAGAAFVVLRFGKKQAVNCESADFPALKIVRERLNFAADAISAIENSLVSAAEALDKKYRISVEDIPERAADRHCRSCPKAMLCWGKYYDEFTREFARIADVIRSGNGNCEMSGECAEICIDPTGAVKAVSYEYEKYISVKTGERRIRELRRIYVDQLEGVRDILRDMGEFNSGVKCSDFAAERRAEKILRESGMQIPQAFVMYDNRGKMRFEAYALTEPRVTPDYIGALLSRSFGRELETPQISGGMGKYRITASEKTMLSAKIGTFQISKGNSGVCGDCYEYFTSSSGIMYIILSDGMGSGSRARVDSAMACSVLSKMLKCGVSMKTALEIVNTVLMVKSADESFATLDICCVDLNSGEGAVYKAGASITYIKSKDRLMRAVLSSSPAGLGGELTVPVQRFTVQSGDVIIMMTDGVSADENWLSRELSQQIEPKSLSERIAKAARLDKTKDDDISVVTMAIF